VFFATALEGAVGSINESEVVGEREREEWARGLLFEDATATGAGDGARLEQLATFPLFVWLCLPNRVGLGHHRILTLHARPSECSSYYRRLRVRGCVRLDVI
jgi:hypothetical protein